MVSTGRSGRTSPDEFIDRLKELVANNNLANKQLLTRLGNLVREADEATPTRSVGVDAPVSRRNCRPRA